MAFRTHVRQLVKDGWEGNVRTSVQQKVKCCGDVGDQNSRFFHASASSRRKTNQIHEWKNDIGQWVELNTGLTDLLTTHYTELFTKSQSNWTTVVDYIETKITPAQNAEKLKSIATEEVKKVLFQMHPDKSPGPDGMMPAFFKKNIEK